MLTPTHSLSSARSKTTLSHTFLFCNTVQRLLLCFELVIVEFVIVQIPFIFGRLLSELIVEYLHAFILKFTLNINAINRCSRLLLNSLPDSQINA